MFISSVKAAGGALLSKPPDYADTLDTIIKCAEIARREGLLALEAKTASIQDPLLRKGLELAIDGTDPGDLSSILEAEVHSNTVYANRQAKLFSDMGGYAPTIGIIGTVLGLVNVLGNLSSPSELGHLIAGAFVATLWGVLSANVMWLPIGAKLKLLADQRAVAGEVVIQGIMAIQAGSNPRMVDTKLRALLTPDALKTLDKAA
jgi:chemotaxis protein MotA